MKIGIGLVATATVLAGCAASSSNPEQAMAPAPGSLRTYDVQTMTQFDDAADDANDWCYTYENEPARYVDRTLEQVRFECSPRAK